MEWLPWQQEPLALYSRRTLRVRFCPIFFCGWKHPLVNHTHCIRALAGLDSALMLSVSARERLFVGSSWDKLKCKAMFWTPLRLAKSTRNHRSKRIDGPSTLTLDRIRAGQEVKVVQIVAGQSATRQLAQFGIRAGTLLKVCRSAPMGGPVLVDSAGSQVAIGRGMARKVSVEILA